MGDPAQAFALALAFPGFDQEEANPHHHHRHQQRQAHRQAPRAPLCSRLTKEDQHQRQTKYCANRVPQPPGPPAEKDAARRDHTRCPKHGHRYACIDQATDGADQQKQNQHFGRCVQGAWIASRPVAGQQCASPGLGCGQKRGHHEQPGPTRHTCLLAGHVLNSQ